MANFKQIKYPTLYGTRHNRVFHLERTILDYALLLCFVGFFFGTNVFRLTYVPGLDFGLYLIRGTLFVMSHYFLWPIVCLTLLLKLKSSHYRTLMAEQIRSNWLFLVFLAYLIGNAFLSPAQGMAFSRLNIFLKYVLPMIAIAFMFPGVNAVSYIRTSFIVYGFIYCFFLLLNRSDMEIFSRNVLTSESRLAVIDSPLATGYLFLICALALISDLLLHHKKTLNSLSFLGICAVLIINAFFTGSRGPMIAFLVTLIVLVIFGHWKLWSKSLIIMIIAVIAYFIYNKMLFLLPLEITYRFENIVDPNREYFYSMVLHYPATLFGQGVGTFLSFANIEYGGYVHNLILEAYLETGLVGLALLVGVYFVAFKRVIRMYRLTRHPSAQFCLVGLIFYFIATNFSGHLLGHKDLYLFTILSMQLPIAQRSLLPAKTLNNSTTLLSIRKLSEFNPDFPFDASNPLNPPLKKGDFPCSPLS